MYVHRRRFEGAVKTNRDAKYFVPLTCDITFKFFNLYLGISRLRSGNACYHSVQNLLSSRLLSKNLKIKIYRTIILPVVLYGCETWSLT